jgi:hypothetical protein
VAVCEVCGGEMMEEISCRSDPIIIEGRAYEPIRWGEERRPKHLPQPDVCSDCSAPLGGVHHPGCCVERCPACLGQALWCPCFTVDEQWDDEDGDGTEGRCWAVRRRARRCRSHLFLRAGRQ